MKLEKNKTYRDTKTGTTYTSTGYNTEIKTPNKPREVKPTHWVQKKLNERR